MRRTPHAGDTAEGIARWWVGVPLEELESVARALRVLERLQIVECRVGADGRERYHIGPALLAEMRRP